MKMNNRDSDTVNSLPSEITVRLTLRTVYFTVSDGSHHCTCTYLRKASCFLMSAVGLTYTSQYSSHRLGAYLPFSKVTPIFLDNQPGNVYHIDKQGNARFKDSPRSAHYPLPHHFL